MFKKARAAMVKAEDSWRAVGGKIIEKEAKLKEQRERQQETLSRNQRLDTSKLNMGAVQSMCTVMADIAKASVDQGLCGDEERMQLGLGLQQLHQLAQTLAMFQGRLQVRGQANQQATVAPGAPRWAPKGPRRIARKEDKSE